MKADEWKMFQIIILLCFSLAVCLRVQAGSTIEELNEGHKLLFSSISSVTGKTESNRHHVKATFDGPSHGVGAQSGSAHDSFVVSSRGATGFRNEKENEEFVRGTQFRNDGGFGYNGGEIEESGITNDQQTGYDEGVLKPDSYQPFPSGFKPVPPVQNADNFIYRNVNTQGFSKVRGSSLPSDFDNLPLVGSASEIDGFQPNQPAGLVGPNTIPNDNGRGSYYDHGVNGGNVPIYSSVNTGSYDAFVPPPMSPYPYGHARNGYSAYHGTVPYPLSNHFPYNNLQHSRHPHQHHQHDHKCRHNQGYQGPESYQTMGHTFKMNTEYKEDGQHAGSFKELNSNGNCGYGSGFCGGYNGAFNRPSI